MTQIYNKAIKDVIEKHPKVGEILDSYKIGCTKCKVGICKLKDVVKIHFLPKEQEEIIFKKIKKVLGGN